MRQSVRRGTIWLVVLATLLLAADCDSARQAAGGQQGQQVQLDVCKLAGEKELQKTLESALDLLFPITTTRDGDEITLSNASVQGVTCPNLNLSIRISLRYRKTKGFPKFSTTGTLDFSSPVACTVTLDKDNPARVAKADACLSDVKVTRVKIRRLPGWLGGNKIRDHLNSQFGGEKCMDLTKLVQDFLDKGGKLQ